jgi:GT2 family glycosyltransferase
LEGWNLRVLILCVNYNCASAIEAMLETVPLNFRNNVEAIIVDNSGELTNQSRCCALTGFQRLHLVSPGQNLGYFGGANAGYAEKDSQMDPDVTMIANPDLLFSDGFFDQLVAQSAVWPSDAGVIFPVVKDSNTQKDSNPFLRTRQDVKYLDTRIFFFGSRLRFSIWMLLHFLKSKVRKQPQAPAKEHGINPIYAGHGSLFLFLPAYFANGASLAFGSFLYAEELFVAEMCLDAGLKCYHDTSLHADHISHITTSALPSEQRRKWQHQSLSYIKQRFF